jgi:hypothetical protein
VIISDANFLNAEGDGRCSRPLAMLSVPACATNMIGMG